ncbi:MAG: RNA 2',3'-cyclic phosphodiesterase, partial [Candidatus Omnitrophota bacterium]|nr:RNA 2',3'-cyclic phosphodiesterase [Candidatus Omnitrophota bacterium]
MSETIRAFIAIELSQEIKDALESIEDSLRTKVSGVKWVRPENIHLTLKFLRHIKVDTLESVKILLNETAENTKPFNIRLSSPGAFPSIGSPRVIWVGIDEGDKESIDLAGRIEEK